MSLAGSAVRSHVVLPTETILDPSKCFEWEKNYPRPLRRSGHEWRSADGRPRSGDHPKAVRDRYGERFRLVTLDSGIKLIPIPDDPLAALRAAASEELREASLDDLEAAAEEAREQAGEHVR